MGSLDNIVSVVGLALGLIGFGFGLYQYYIAQKWKQSEFAAAQVEKLASDPLLNTCCKMLDWSERPLAVPEAYLALTPDKTFQHNYDLLIRAMRTEVQQPTYTWQEMIYRDLFDHFFTYLERINHYIRIKLVTVDEVRALEYWLQQIASPRFTHQPVFRDFIKHYGYTGVEELIRRFNIQFR